MKISINYNLYHGKRLNLKIMSDKNKKNILPKIKSHNKNQKQTRNQNNKNNANNLPITSLKLILKCIKKNIFKI